MRPNQITSKPGFTLIELLVVIAIISLLISILLPSIASARGIARQIVGAAIHKNLGTAQTLYMNNFKDQYAGRNTSGGAWSGIYIGQNPIVRANLLPGDTSPETPTSTEDWISPIIGDSMGFSPNRARRTQQIFRNLRDPAARLTNDVLYVGSGVTTDSQDFRNVIADGGFQQVSFLTPAPFHYLSNVWQDVRVDQGAPAFGLSKAAGDFGQPAVSPRDFRPRLERVGTQLSSKILVLDGTRYLSVTGLDFDISANPGIYGSFSDNPAFAGSTAYGRVAQGQSSGLGWKLSARHPTHTMNATFFDGHTASMNITELWREPKYVYPSGSIWNGTEGNPEAIAKYPSGTVID